MSGESKARIEKARRAFRREMILTLAEVADLIHSSIYTARRRLKEWQALTSYNQNGRYYALPDVPTFDGNGLWQRRGVYFSRYGNLKQTVAELVRRSQAGLDAGDMRSLLGLDPWSFLSAFAKHPQLKREKARGRFVYYCSDPDLYSKQRQRRWALNTKGRQPTPSEAVAILVEKIKHPALSTAALSKRLRKQNMFVEPEIIQNLFARHDLTLKKTPHSV
jgi:hypothetical protein